ncbi:MFS transporter [Geranomyces variabilis]|nr:MFS transporter [Geranomyces variabilis]
MAAASLPPLPGPPPPTRWHNHVFAELGLSAVYRSSVDTKCLLTQRFARLFAYGGSALTLVAYLSALDISDSRIGLFMTLTIAGDVLISFLLTLFADGLGRRTVLLLGAALMVASGVVFALSGNYWVLLMAAILGVISPSGSEIGPFRAIEESTLAHLTPPADRSDIFAWYTLIGVAGSAFGLMASGWALHALERAEGWDELRAYRVIFYAYAAIGALKFGLALMLSERIEIAQVRERNPGPASETTALLGSNASSGSLATTNRHYFQKTKDLLPRITPASRAIFIQLALLFAIDSFASGLASLSWVITFFQRKFDMPAGQLGSLFFTASIIGAASTLVASSLARRIGNIKTMAFTHLPSSVALALIPVPQTLRGAMVPLFIRHSLSLMDVAPRSAFLAAVVLPHERTAVMGAINVVKTSAQSIGPLITGVLVGRNLFWVAFVAAGCLKAAYDVGILVTFVGHRPREEEHAEGGNDSEDGDSV